MVQYVGASFDSVTNNSVVANFGKTYEDGGIFFFTPKENKKILNVNFKGHSGCEKYLDMIAYLFELGYDISINPSKNDSDSPGFESGGLLTVS